MDAVRFHTACIPATRCTHSDVMSPTVTFRPCARIDPATLQPSNSAAKPSAEDTLARSSASVKVPIKRSKRSRLLQHERKQFFWKLMHERNLRAHLEGRASIQAQRIIRGHLTRKSLNSCNQDAENADDLQAVSGQDQADVAAFLRQFRRDVAKAHQLIPRQRHKRMVVKLQSVVRGFVVRRALRPTKSYALLVRQEAAARKVQAVWRCYSYTLRSNAQLYSEMHQACTRIQAFMRGYLGRNFVELLHQAMRIETENVRSAVKIQALFRKTAAVKSKQTKKFDKASLLIQKTYRMHLTKRQIKDQYRAATKLQATLRGRRDRILLQQQQHHAAATRIQSVRRGQQERKRRAEKQKESAAVVIQSASRRRAAAKEINRRRTAETEKDEAAVIIQGCMRKRRAHRRVAKKRADRSAKAATSIQCTARRRAATKELQRRKLQQQRDKSARILQKAERRRQRLLRKKQEQASIHIQKVYRGARVRRPKAT